MKITNAMGLPNALLSAIAEHQTKPDNKVFRVTRLISPPRQIQLMIRHWDDIEQDASDMLWAIFGTAVHSVFDKVKEEGCIQERRIEKKIGKIKVSGQFDLYDIKKKKISDWKTASVWKYKYKDYHDWTKQFNIYAWLANSDGLDVKELEAIALFKDWKKRDSLKDKSYPKCAVMGIPIQLHSIEETEHFVLNRVKLHYDNISLTDNELTPCTDDEMWNRSGYRRRCEEYCPANKFCNQYLDYKEEQNEKEIQSV